MLLLPLELQVVQVLMEPQGQQDLQVPLTLPVPLVQVVLMEQPERQVIQEQVIQADQVALLDPLVQQVLQV